MPSYKLEARVKSNSPTSIVTAFAGCEYVKSGWRPVPANSKAEAQAKVHPLLDVREINRNVQNDAKAESVAAQSQKKPGK